MIYLIIAALIIFGVFKYDVYSSSKNKLPYFQFIFFLLWFLAAFRYRVGSSDTIAYIEEYAQSLSLFNLSWHDIFGDINRRPGWNILIGLCRQISNDYVPFTIIHSFALNFTVYHFIKKYSKMIFVSTLLYFTCFYTNLCFCAMREALAVAVFLWGIDSYINNKWVRYYIIAYIASLFHISSVIILIFPLLKLIKPTKITIICASILFVIGLSFLPYIGDYLRGLSIWTDMGDFGSKATNYLFADQYYYSGTLSSIIKGTLVGVCVPLLFVWYSIKHQIAKQWLIPLVLMYILLGIINMSTPIFYRYQTYLQIVFAVFISNCCYVLTHNKTSQQRHKSLLLFVAILSIVYFPVKLKFFSPAPENPRLKTYHYYVPYKSVFFRNTDSERELLYQNTF